MKKLLLLLLLCLMPAPAMAASTGADIGLNTRSDCDSILNPFASGTICVQTTTTGGRVAGGIYLRNAANTAWDDVKGGLDRLSSTVQNRLIYEAVDAGSSDAYAGTDAARSISSYTTAGLYSVKLNTANTGAATLALGGITPAVAIKKWVSGSKVDTDTGDFCAGQTVLFGYDGTHFIVLSQLCAGTTSGGVTMTSPSGNDNRVVRTDGTGRVVQSSGVTLNDSNRMGIPGGADLGDISGGTVSFNAAGAGDRTYTVPGVDGKMAATTGSLTNGNCAKFNSDGLLVDHGSACGGGSFSGAQVRVYNNADIAIASATDVALTYNSERWDSAAFHSTSVNTGRLTFSANRSCVVTANVGFASAAGSVRILTILLNGTTEIGQARIPPTGGGFSTVMSVTTNYNFVNTDYVEVIAHQDSGSTINVTAAGNRSPEFSAICAN